MEGDVFRRQIIVVFIVGVEVFHLFLVERYFQNTLILFAAEIAAVCQIGKGKRKGGRQRQFHQQFLLLLTVIVNIAVCLHFFRADIPVEKIIKCQKRKQMQHPLDIGAVMEKQQSAGVSGKGLHICFVNFNQFPAMKAVFPGNAKKRFQRFLFTVWNVQKCFVGRNASIQIDPGKAVKIVRKFMLFAFLHQVWQVKIIAVEMDQMRERGCKVKKGVQQGSFLYGIIAEPLPDLPVSVRKESGSDQIEGGAFCGESRGFNIYKQKLIQGSGALQRITDFERFQCLIYDLHKFPPSRYSQCARFIAFAYILTHFLN